MNQPGRLFDETDDDLERLLLASGRSERSSDQARAQTLAALGIASSAVLGSAVLGSATAASTVAASTAPTAALGKLTWTKMLIGLSALGVVAVIPPAYHAWRRHGAPPAGLAAGGAVVASVAGDGIASHAPLPAATVPVAVPATVPVMVRRPAAALGRAAGERASLTRELGALDAIRAALARGEAPRALGLLDTYARRYPQGRLALEAEILRIDALAKAGRADDAHERAAVFLRRHPNSVLTARARRYLDD
jgi:hypothetical protein